MGNYLNRLTAPGNLKPKTYSHAALRRHLAVVCRQASICSGTPCESIVATAAATASPMLLPPPSSSAMYSCCALTWTSRHHRHEYLRCLKRHGQQILTRVALWDTRGNRVEPLGRAYYICIYYGCMATTYVWALQPWSSTSTPKKTRNSTDRQSLDSIGQQRPQPTLLLLQRHVQHILKQGRYAAQSDAEHMGTKIDSKND